MTTKHGSIVTFLDGLLPIKSHDPFISLIRSRDKLKLVSAANKLGRMVTYLDVLLTIKPDDILIK